jgi:hypothetical protein
LSSRSRLEWEDKSRKKARGKNEKALFFNCHIVAIAVKMIFTFEDSNSDG